MKTVKTGLRVLAATAALLGGELLGARPALALNYFELEVYPYRTAAKGEFELENQTTYSAQGTRTGNNDGMTRSSLEAVYGVTNKLEVAAYGDFMHAPGGSWRFAGQRYHARMSFFHKDQLPVDLGAYVEYEIPHNEHGTRDVELRGILEKDFGKWTFDVNPIFERAVRGPKVNGGWELQYAAAAIYRLNERVQPRLEFFGDFGPINNFEPRDQQKHIISPAVGIKLGPTFHMLAGVGFGLTRATEQRLVRMQLEWEFY